MDARSGHAKGCKLWKKRRAKIKARKKRSRGDKQP